MVRIIDYKTRQKEDGTEFYLLEVQGGIEMVKSKETGLYYATAKKATVSTTFYEETCKSLIGTEMPGRITKIKTPAYQYTIKETGEIISLEHKYVYLPEDVEKEDIKDLVGKVFDFYGEIKVVPIYDISYLFKATDKEKWKLIKILEKL